MQTITGTVVETFSLVQGGCTVHFFTLMKEKRSYMESPDKMYAAVFVQLPLEPESVSVGTGGQRTAKGPTHLALQLAARKSGLQVEVTVDTADELPEGPEPDLANSVYVTAVKPVPQDTSANFRYI